MARIYNPSQSMKYLKSSRDIFAKDNVLAKRLVQFPVCKIIPEPYGGSEDRVTSQLLPDKASVSEFMQIKPSLPEKINYKDIDSIIGCLVDESRQLKSEGFRLNDQAFPYFRISGISNARGAAIYLLNSRNSEAMEAFVRSAIDAPHEEIADILNDTKLSSSAAGIFIYLFPSANMREIFKYVKNRRIARILNIRDGCEACGNISNKIFSLLSPPRIFDILLYLTDKKIKEILSSINVKNNRDLFSGLPSAARKSDNSRSNKIIEICLDILEDYNRKDRSFDITRNIQMK